MKKYIVYEWFADDEGGIGICLSNEYTNNFNGCKTEKIGEFDTTRELANILLAEYSNIYIDYDIHNALYDACNLITQQTEKSYTYQL